MQHAYSGGKCQQSESLFPQRVVWFNTINNLFTVARGKLSITETLSVFLQCNAVYRCCANAVDMM